jgi:hypothetical protein
MLDRAIAKVISYLFHPLLMPTLGAVLILNIGGYMAFSVAPAIKYIAVAIIFTFTFVLPSFASYYLLKKGHIQSMGMATIQERRLPMLLTALFYFFSYYILRNASLPPVLFLMILGATLSLLLTLIITLAWKISTHMVGMGGITGAIIGLSIKFSINLQVLIIALIICSGLVAFARLKLSAHTHNQVYWGFLVGLLSMMLLIVGI